MDRAVAVAVAVADQVPGEPGEEWLRSIKIELSKLSPLSSSWSICRVPNKLRTLNDDAYIPHIVSIGPLHHGTKSAMPAMEDYKLHYMLSLLERTQDAIRTLDACGSAIIRLDERVRACYAETIEFKENELAEMMLRDGCFIIELFLRYSIDGLRLASDPIFTSSWMMLALQRDLALLENQIPLFVLQELFILTVMRSAIGPSASSLHLIALRFFKSAFNLDQETFQVIRPQRSCNHLLHLIHNWCLPTSPRLDPRRQQGAWEFIHSASTLAQAGIEFQKETTKNLFNLKFEKGVLKVPQLRIHDATDSLFRNLIALEQCFHGNGQYITSYLLLMDRLVDTAGDVELLVEKRIIENDLGGFEDVSALLNNICKQVVLQDFYFAGLCEQVNAYCNTRWHRYRAALKRDYFKNPWTIISFIGGVTLLSLTAVQTIYSILGYYPH